MKVEMNNDSFPILFWGGGGGVGGWVGGGGGERMGRMGRKSGDFPLK